MTDGFQIADMIELHDAGIVLVHHDYPDGVTGFGSYPSVGGKAITVEGSTLQDLAEFFGLPLFPQEHTLKSGGVVHSRLEHKSFGITSSRTVIGGGKLQVNYSMPLPDDYDVPIHSLSARVLGPNLLDFIVKFLFEENGQPYTVSRRLTYSGTFTIWWADQESESDGS
jgi:hypothetical protein